MGRKSRCLAYVRLNMKREKRKSSPVSVLKKLQELKERTDVGKAPDREGRDE